MRIKIKKEVEVEKEVEFPCYTKSRIGVIKFISPRICFFAKKAVTETAKTRHEPYPECWLLDEPATEDEFNEMFAEVDAILNSSL